MDKIITIQDSQVKPLASFLRDQQQRISAEIAEYREKISLLEEQYEANETTLLSLGVDENFLSTDTKLLMNGFDPELSSVFVIPSRPINGYTSAGSWWEKSLYILKKEEKALTAKEILKLIFEYEPELKQVGNDKRKRIEVNVFSTLTHKAKDSQVGRVKIDNEYKYGLPNWFDKNGKLKREFMA